jgi:LysR family transcriptional activator of nhaA
LTRAAEHLNLSQSALSVQLRQLEENLGEPLFTRHNKRLILTEAGRVALDYAESIFRSGEELLDTFANREGTGHKVLRVGAAATLSRNFQIDFLRPVVHRTDVRVVLRSATLRELLSRLQAHTIDVVLSNLPVRRDAETAWHSHLLDEEPVSLVGRPTGNRKKFSFPEDLRTTPVLLPSLESNVRAAFDLLMDQAHIRPIIAAEVDDMAMLRLLARDSDALALVPKIVVQDELREGVLIERHRIPNLKESFYAITPTRKFPNPLLRDLIQRWKGK